MEYMKSFKRLILKHVGYLIRAELNVPHWIFCNISFKQNNHIVMCLNPTRQTFVLQANKQKSDCAQNLYVITFKKKNRKI